MRGFALLTVMAALFTLSMALSCRRSTSPVPDPGPPIPAQKLDELARRLRSLNHADTFTPWGSYYFESLEAFEEIKSLGPRALGVLLDFLEDPTHDYLISKSILERAWELDDSKVRETLLRIARNPEFNIEERSWARFSLCKWNMKYEEHFLALCETFRSILLRGRVRGSTFFLALESPPELRGVIPAAIALAQLGDERVLACFRDAAGFDCHLDWVIASEIRRFQSAGVVPILQKIIEARMEGIPALLKISWYFHPDNFPFDCGTQPRDIVWYELRTEVRVLLIAMGALRDRDALTANQFRAVLAASCLDLYLDAGSESLDSILTFELIRHFESTLPFDGENDRWSPEWKKADPDLIEKWIENLRKHLIENGAWSVEEECFNAARAGDIPFLEKAFEFGFDIDTSGPEGRTLLHTALHHNQLETARWLVYFKAEIAIGDDRGWTPLHVAAWNGESELVSLLLTYGADRSAKTRSGRTPLDLARENEHSEVLEILEK